MMAGAGMRITRRAGPSGSSAVPGRGAVVTIGAYDGVHAGHRAVLRLVRELADARGLEATLLTFDRHPAEVVRPESAPCVLTPLEHKLELLAATGYVDRCEVLTFDAERAGEEAEDFVRDVLADGLAARMVVVGADFHFGRARRGNVGLLQRMGAELGFEVVGLGLEADAGGATISSTRIRALLHDGDVEAAAALLTRRHEVRGTVVHGDHRGRELGFPTANVALPVVTCLPADGIYAGTAVTPDGMPRPAAISLGRRPTFYASAEHPLLEAHLIDFEGDLYGGPLRVAFASRLRGEERFDSVEALVGQMHRDVEAARRALAC